MKRYLISSVAVVMVLGVVFAAFAQEERRSGRSSGRSSRMTQEQRLEAIKVIETELAKLKKAPQISRPTGSYSDMSEDERTKFFEQMRKVYGERRKVYQAILAQVYGLQGQRPPEEEDAVYVLTNSTVLKSIQESATKEKAKETAELIESLVARASGQRGPGGSRSGSSQRPQGDRSSR